MTTQVQFRRGNTAQTLAFTGALAELTVDTDQKTVVVHDGVTPGGTTLSTKGFSQAAFDKANSANVLAQAAFDYANSILSLDTNIDTTARLIANTATNNITILQGVNATQNTNITILQGVNATQNTNITNADTKAQAAFDKANTLGSNTTLTYSNTASGTFPSTNTLKPGEPSINLNDGRMFIQLNNGQVIDISSVAVGNTWYVATNGNDNFKGDTHSSAKATIAAALAAAQPGDSVIVHSGTYNEVTPLIVPQNVQLQGSGERTCLVRPVTSSNNILYVNNNSYVTGFKFVDYTGAAISFPPAVLETGTAQAGSTNTITLNSGASIYTDYYKTMQVTITGGTGSGQSANIISYNATTKVATVDVNWSTTPTSSSVYSLSIPRRTTPASTSSRYSTFITGSPYIYNSSSITTGGTGIKVDGDLATGNKSIISAQFTQVNSGGTGIHILNDGYAQLVSIYGIFCDTAFLAESGGTASLGNCNVNFGNRGLVANGHGKLAMTATLNGDSVAAALTVSLNNVVANSSLGITASIPYTGLIMKIDGDSPSSYYSVTEATPLSSGNTTVTFQTALPNTWPSGTSVSFYQQSQLRASGQTFEFVGGGTNIAALPRSGGVANTLAQTVAIDEGAVYATSTDQSGNFTVSDLTINQSTSTITGRTFAKSLFAEMTPYILALEG